MAFIVDDFTCGLDRSYLALVGARLAGRAALVAAAQPVEDTKTGNKTQPGAKWAQVFAVELAVNGRHGQ